MVCVWSSAAKTSEDARIDLHVDLDLTKNESDYTLVRLEARLKDGDKKFRIQPELDLLAIQFRTSPRDESEVEAFGFRNGLDCIVALEPFHGLAEPLRIPVNKIFFLAAPTLPETTCLIRR